jgi:translation initiation factor 1
MTASSSKDPRPPDDSPAQGGSLRHNPFAALRGKVREVPAAPESTPAAAPVPKPSRPESRGRITVRQERSGRGGKTVTIAEGPGLAGRDLAKLAREASTALGLGARVENGGLVLQGDQRERLAVWLATRGYTQVVRGN